MSTESKRVYAVAFAFNCAAAIVCAIGAAYIPGLRDAAIVFALSAIFFRIGTVKL